MDNNDFEARSKSGNIALFGIICITVLFFILTRGGANTQLVNFLALTPGTLRDFQLWRLVTSLLVNYDPWNLFFAMFTLYIFGNLSTPVLGPHKTICLYLFSGVIGNLLLLAFVWRYPDTPILGCYGAVMGVLMASAMILPNMQMYLLFIPFPIKIKTMAIVFFVFYLLFTQMSVYSSMIVGGFLGGYLFMKLFARKHVSWELLDLLFVKRRGAAQNPRPAYTFNPNPSPRKDKSPVDSNEVDRILDKLSRTGINSLTPEEVKVLEDLRERMRKK